MTLFRLPAPDAMVMEDLGTFKSFAKNSMQASLARPSMGGVVRESLMASPSSPVMAFFLARGWTLTTKLTASSVSITFINLLAAPFGKSDQSENHSDSNGNVD